MKEDLKFSRAGLFCDFALNSFSISLTVFDISKKRLFLAYGRYESNPSSLIYLMPLTYLRNLLIHLEDWVVVDFRRILGSSKFLPKGLELFVYLRHVRIKKNITEVHKSLIR